jgi:hypothetical protein
MNRWWKTVFHSPAQSSFELVVNAMWKLCKVEKESGMRPAYTVVSEEFGTDF